MSRSYLTAGLLLAWLACCALSFAAGWSWRGDRADLAGSVVENAATHEALSGEQVARAVDRDQVNEAQRAADVADDRQEQINADYQTRIAAAAAGRDGELGRLRGHWASCETSRLADGAAAAAAAAEENRLRRVSAAGIVRACELAQSERDEAVDRYLAVETAINGAKRL